jgi:hypothetical protein
MREQLLIGAIAATLGFSSSAPAAVIVTIIPRGVPVGSGGAPIAVGYHGYTIRLTENTGANITAVDLESGTNGLFGPFVQRWTSSGGDGVYDTPTVNVTGNNENLTNSVINFDSHLLQPGSPKADSNYVGKINFSEDPGVPFAPSGTPVPPFGTNSDSAGFVVSALNGTIQGAFGINGAAQSSTLDLAYVVLPDGGVGFFPGTMLVAVAGGPPQLVVHPFGLIPEPATVLTLSLCGGMLLGRRRKSNSTGEGSTL